MLRELSGFSLGSFPGIKIEYGEVVDLVIVDEEV
jgi:hypothetical protein